MKYVITFVKAAYDRVEVEVEAENVDAVNKMLDADDGLWYEAAGKSKLSGIHGNIMSEQWVEGIEDEDAYAKRMEKEKKEKERLKDLPF